MNISGFHLNISFNGRGGTYVHGSCLFIKNVLNISIHKGMFYHKSDTCMDMARDKFSRQIKFLLD